MSNKGPFKARVNRSDWLKRARRASEWSETLNTKVQSCNQLTTNLLMDVSDAIHLLEITYARCLEVRCQTHYAVALRNEWLDSDDVNNYNPKDRDFIGREQRTFRNYVMSEAICEGANGLLMKNAFTSVRHLGASTLATIFFGDPNGFFVWKSKISSNKQHVGYVNPEQHGYDVRLLDSDDEFSDDEDDEENLVTMESMDVEDDNGTPMDTANDTEIEHKSRYHEALGEGGRVVQICVESQASPNICRIYNSAHVAAIMMNVHIEPILDACKGKRSEAYGYKWRFYRKGDVDKSDSFSNLLAKLKVKPVHRKLPKESLKTYTISKQIYSNQKDITNKQLDYYNDTQKQRTATNTPLPDDLVSSRVIVSHRLAKLKSELLNMVSLIQPKFLKWHHAPLVNERVSAADSDTFAYVVESDELSLAHALMRARREVLHYSFILMVQDAATSQALMNCVLSFEAALPRTALIQNSTNNLPCYANTASYVGLRLYALDSLIRWENLPIDLYYIESKYKPRFHLQPRCVLSAACSRPFGHSRKCTDFCEVSQLSSRYQDSMSSIEREREEFEFMKNIPLTSNQSRYGTTGGKANKRTHGSDEESEEDDWDSDSEDDFDMAKSKKPAHRLDAWQVNVEAIIPDKPIRTNTIQIIRV
jgi:hypothetical protein